jgi:hypothetical protein
MKMMIIGHARHGKDTVCEILKQHHGLSWQSSSEAAAASIVYPAMRDVYGYQTVEECLNDRINHRPTWHSLIWEYNRNDPARLARQVYASSDIYCGMRHATELAATRAEHLFDFCIWVDRSQYRAAEGTDSNGVTPAMADYWLDNNGTLADLERNIHHMMDVLQSTLDQNKAWQETAA